MSKPTVLFVAAAMAVTAVCVAVIVTVGLGMSFGVGVLTAFAALAAMAVVHLAFLRTPAVDDQRLDEFDGMLAELQGRFAAIEQRLTTLDGAVGERAKAAVRPLVEEIAALGGLVNSIAKEVAAHDLTLTALKTPPAAGHILKAPAPAQPPAAAPQPPAPEPAAASAPYIAPAPYAAPASSPAPIAAAQTETVTAPVEPIAPVAARAHMSPPPPVRPEPPAARAPAAPAPAVRPAPPAARPAPPPPLVRPAPAEKPQAPDSFDPAEFEPPPTDTPAYLGASDRGLAARIELALRDDRVDFYLQPVVSLPSRRVTHYEGLSRLREPDGLVLPAEFLPVASAEGRLPEIDRRAIERAAKVAVRLNARGRGIGIFVNVAPETLADERVFREITALLDRNPDLSRLLVLELTQAGFDGLGPVERETVGSLFERGLRFAIDNVIDLRLDPRDLSRRGVRFVKISAERLLDPDASRGATIHTADMAGLLSRHGVELIADQVERERTVPELLDFDVKSAQGFLFGVARPVRGEVTGGEEAVSGGAMPGPADPASRPFTPPSVVRRA